jgi:hypothetical protein
MLPLYLFAAILGAGLLLVGMIGGDGDADATHHGNGTNGAGSGWAQILSSRTLSYALAAFGLTGAGLTFAGSGFLLTLLLALAMAGVGWALAYFAFRWLSTSQGGFGEPSSNYVGGIGNTEVRIPDGGRGRIQLLHRGRSFTLSAMSIDGEIDRNETVVVVDVVEGVAIVGRAPEELFP